MAATIAQGEIVWAEMPDSRGGNRKRRPAVVVSAGIDAAGDVHVAAITTLIGEAPFSEAVELPHNPRGHDTTGLKRACEVVCSWVVRIPAGNAERTGGSVPVDELNEILAKVKSLN